MRSIVHIGLSKTGTTSLQRTLTQSREYLLSRGVLYPESPEPLFRNNHAPLAGLITPFGMLRRKVRVVFEPEQQFQAKRRGYIDALTSQIEETRPHCLVLSAEQLGKTIQDAGGADVIRELCGDDLTVVMYARRPSARYLSRLAEHFKAAHDIPAFRFGVLDILDSYENAFGRDVVEVRVFDDEALANGDIVDDFSHAYLAPFGVDRQRLTAAGRRNAVMSAESMAVMQRYRRDFHPSEANQYQPGAEALARALRSADRAVEAPRPAFRPGIADRIDYGNDEALILRDRTGAAFPGFDYQRLERGEFASPLSDAPALVDLVCIDREVQRGILACLAKGDWAGDSTVRMDWLRRTTSDIAVV